jgi:hypothetical protein
MRKNNPPSAATEESALPMMPTPSSEAQADIPDFTTEQWLRLKERTAILERDYVPTRTLIPGL